MLKKTMTYTDYDGMERTEDFYFNLTRAECLELEMGTAGGLEKMIKQIVSEKDTKRIIEMFKEIIMKAYGVKSPDGRRFIKTQEVRDAFAQTEAYSNLFVELATNADAAAEFINGIVPPPIKAADTDVALPTA